MLRRTNSPFVCSSARSLITTVSIKFVFHRLSERHFTKLLVCARRRACFTPWSNSALTLWLLWKYVAAVKIKMLSLSRQLVALRLSFRVVQVTFCCKTQEQQRRRQSVGSVRLASYRRRHRHLPCPRSRHRRIRTRDLRQQSIDWWTITSSCLPVFDSLSSSTKRATKTLSCSTSWLPRSSTRLQIPWINAVCCIERRSVCCSQWRQRWVVICSVVACSRDVTANKRIKRRHDRIRFTAVSYWRDCLLHRPSAKSRHLQTTGTRVLLSLAFSS